MYNGVGLTSVRGTATSGHVQANRSHINPNRRRWLEEQRRRGDDRGGRGSGWNRNDKDRSRHMQTPAMNDQLLDHQRKRMLENRLLELREQLETANKLTEEEIDERIQAERTTAEELEKERTKMNESHNSVEADKPDNDQSTKIDNDDEQLEEGEEPDDKAQQVQLARKNAALKDQQTKNLLKNKDSCNDTRDRNFNQSHSGQTRHDRWDKHNDKRYSDSRSSQNYNTSTDQRNMRKEINLADAFGIKTENHVAGSAFDRELQETRKQQRQEERDKQEQMIAKQARKDARDVLRKEKTDEKEVRQQQKKLEVMDKNRKRSSSRKHNRRRRDYSSSSSSSSSSSDSDSRSYSSSSSSSSSSGSSSYSSSSYSSSSASTRQSSSQSSSSRDHRRRRRQHPDRRRDDTKERSRNVRSERDSNEMGREKSSRSVGTNPKIIQIDRSHSRQKSRSEKHKRSPSISSSSSTTSTTSRGSQKRQRRNRRSPSRHQRTASKTKMDRREQVRDTPAVSSPRHSNKSIDTEKNNKIGGQDTSSASLPIEKRELKHDQPSEKANIDSQHKIVESKNDRRRSIKSDDIPKRNDRKRQRSPSSGSSTHSSVSSSSSRSSESSDTSHTTSDSRRRRAVDKSNKKSTKEKDKSSTSGTGKKSSRQE